MHVRAVDLEKSPAPFLNRFEKFRLSIKEILSHKLEKCLFLSRIVARSKKQIKKLTSIISLCGYVMDQTVETILLDLLSNASILELGSISVKVLDLTERSFFEYFRVFSKDMIGICLLQSDFDQLCSYGLRFLPLSQAEALKELTTKVKIYNIHNIVEAFEECLCDKPQTIVTMLTESLFEMLITRKVLLCLLELASPEEIFKKRNYLPMDLVKEYFQQEHFSLKTLLQSIPVCGKPRNSKLLKYVIHTRSNGQVMDIPTIRLADKEKLQKP